MKIFTDRSKKFVVCVSTENPLATQDYNLSKTSLLLSACQTYGKNKYFFTFISGALRIQYRPSSKLMTILHVLLTMEKLCLSASNFTGRD